MNRIPNSNAVLQSTAHVASNPSADGAAVERESKHASNSTSRTVSGGKFRQLRRHKTGAIGRRPSSPNTHFSLVDPATVSQLCNDVDLVPSIEVAQQCEPPDWGNLLPQQFFLWEAIEQRPNSTDDRLIASEYPPDFEELHRAHWDGLVAAIAKKGVQDPELVASKVIQAALRNFDPKRSRFTRRLNFIKRQQIASALRTSYRNRMLIVEDSVDPDSLCISSEPSQYSHQLIDALICALTALKPQQILLIQLRFCETLTCQQIAQKVWLSETAVKNRLHRLYTTLRRRVLRVLMRQDMPGVLDAHRTGSNSTPRPRKQMPRSERSETAHQAD